MTFPHQSSRDVHPVQQPGARSGDDVLLALLKPMVQAAIEAEFRGFMGAAPWERSEQRQGWRNGTKTRRWKTRIGMLELRIPKDRAGQFQPTLFERYQRSEKALVATLIEMYVQGISTRKVSKIVEELCGTSVSASQVSALVKTLDAEREAWRTRSLAATRYPYLIVDAHYEKVRRDRQVNGTAVLWVIGINEQGYREHLGVWLGITESMDSWSAVFRDLAQRGLEGVSYVVADEHLGLQQALQRYFPNAHTQRCQVHYLRNVNGKVTSDALAREIKTGLRDAWAAPTRAEADARLARLLDRLREPHPKIAEWIESSVEHTLAFFALQLPAHRRRLRTTNSMEHDHAEIRRRTRVIRIFPNDESLLRMASALAMERNEKWLDRKYLWMEAERQDNSADRLRQIA